MRIAVTVVRIFTGLLFIFSGLVKAIDPKGLAYKMQEFFEAFAQSGWIPSLMSALYDHALTFSIIMITLEIIVGVGLLLGWQKKFIAWMLLLLMLLFTFLTSYVLFSGKIRACGCFGDCIPITPIQTFSKDIILLIFAIFLLLNLKYIRPVTKPLILIFYMLVATALTLYLQFYVLNHLPVVDCLPFKKGNDIVRLRQMPEGAIPDKFEYVFVYKKGGEQKEFSMASLPDSSWEFVDRKQKLVQKGKNNIPLINDFSFTDSSGAEVTEQILSQPDVYYLIYMKEIPDNISSVREGLVNMVKRIGNVKIYVITSQRNAVLDFFKKANINVTDIYTCDAIAIKTAARTNPTIYRMKGPVVQDKWGLGDIFKVAR